MMPWTMIAITAVCGLACIGAVASSWRKDPHTTSSERVAAAYEASAWAFVILIAWGLLS